ncbi:MAG: hypothetical protein WCH86_00010 [Kiritimatiellales bacterium]
MKKAIIVFSLIASFSGCSGQSQLSVRDIFANGQVRKLADAAAQGNTNAVDILLSKGVDVNFVGKDGVTPLTWVMVKGNKIGFEHLLKCGADPNVRLGAMDTLLFLAVKVEDPFFLETALKYGGDPNQRKFWMTEVNPNGSIDKDISLLWYTISTAVSKSDKVRILVKHGADVKESDGSRDVVRACAMINDYENVYTFLEAGAPYSTNREPYTLLERLENRAVHPEDSEYVWRNKVVEFLRDRGIKVTPKEWERKDQPTIINIQTK